MPDLPQPTAAYFEKHDPERNISRFYSMMIMPNLFGEWSLYRQWGRVGRRGQIRILIFPSHEQARRQFVAIRSLREKHGYSIKPEQIEMF